jgi:hypothetical protein
METARVRTKELLQLARDFERSRLEEQLVSAAYELAAPLLRRSLSSWVADVDRSQGMDEEERTYQPVGERRCA